MEAVILVAASKIRRVVLVLADMVSQIHVSHPTWYHISNELVILHGTTSATREVNHPTLIVQK